MQQAIVVLTNLPDAAVARAMARELIELRLAACVNILPAVQSVYRWQGAVEEATEVSLLVKTVRGRYAALEAAIKAAHPYEVPEIIALDIAEGWAGYLDWIVEETKKDVDV